MSRRAAIAITVAVVIGAPASRADETVKAFVCTFTEGSAANYDKGSFKSEAASPIRFEIADIALSAQTAVRVNSEQRTVVRVFRGVSALNVLEIVAEGYLNVTTIYDSDGKRHPAVHARHFGVLGQPVVSHYRGSCVAK